MQATKHLFGGLTLAILALAVTMLAFVEPVTYKAKLVGHSIMDTMGSVGAASLSVMRAAHGNQAGFVKLAVPENAEDLETFLSDAKNLEAAFADTESTKDFMVRYAEAANKADPGLSEQIAAEVKATAEKLIAELEIDKSTIKRLPMGEEAKMLQVLSGDKSIRQRGIYDPDAAGAPLDGEFKRLGDFYKTIDWQTIQRGGVDSRLVEKVLNEAQGDQGGFLVPEEFRAELLALAIEDSIVRPRATVIPMNTLSIRFPTIRDTSHATSVFGGIIAYWTPESGSITQTEPSFGSARLEAKKLVGGTRTSNELIKDSAVSVEALLNNRFPAAIAYFEDDAFINGVGAGQPLGIINADALISVAKETGQAASTILWQNIIKMYSRMLPSSIGRGVWLANHDTFPQLATMSLEVGTGGSAVWLNNGVGGPPATILGRPVILTEKTQTLGTAGDLFFVDLSYYLIGDRQSLEMASSQHVRFNTDQTDWKFVQRVDGRPWVDSALTPRNGSNTLSPFVSLATRA